MPPQVRVKVKVVKAYDDSIWSSCRSSPEKGKPGRDSFMKPPFLVAPATVINAPRHEAAMAFCRKMRMRWMSWAFSRLLLRAIPMAPPVTEVQACLQEMLPMQETINAARDRSSEPAHRGPVYSSGLHR